MGALAVLAAAAPFADSDQAAGLVTLALIILGYSLFRLAVAVGWLSAGSVEGTLTIRRVRQQHRLLSRTWLELRESGRSRWLPVYFDPALLALAESPASVDRKTLRVGDIRLYPSGRVRTTEPPGKLIDNPSRPDPEAAALGAKAARPTRRLLLDAQSAVAAPFFGLMWIYVIGGGLLTFVGAVCVAAAAAIWLSAVRGSDPS
ncbi:hypothetical protein D5S18_12980 [Nocardia panacis]|uniref:Uncharacterized protein n=1 Tax=Nocardia panacis TaxID=2340916 RepID=A0A3A4KEY3_9NOCA|nr:hypothetical protein D5S18_12980 [Nocardia panacis]